MTEATYQVEEDGVVEDAIRFEFTNCHVPDWVQTAVQRYASLMMHEAQLLRAEAGLGVEPSGEREFIAVRRPTLLP